MVSGQGLNLPTSCIESLRIILRESACSSESNCCFLRNMVVFESLSLPLLVGKDKVK